MAVNWQRTVLRVMGAREQPATVTAVEDVRPWYRRVHLSSPDFLRDLEVFPTVWIRLWVPGLDDDTVLKQRGYTLVDPDPAAGTFALEFVLHEPTGPAARWARQTRPGDTVEFSFTPARLVPDPAIGTYVLAGDASAIPAINSLLGHLPASAGVHVVLIDPHADEAELPLRKREGATVTVVRSGADQVAHIEGLDRDDCYVWAAGERQDVAAVRELIRKRWKLPKEHQHTQYYWIRGKAFG